MSLTHFKQHFAAGKIRLKYSIIEPKYGRTKRIFIEWLLVPVFLLAVLGAVILENTISFYAYALVLGVFVLEFYLFKIINRTTQIGVLYFDDEELIIEQDGKIVIPYNQIHLINFKLYMKKPGSTTRGDRGRNWFAYILQICSDEKKYVLPVKNELTLTEDDLLQFHRYYPRLTDTLEELFKTYRIT